MPRPLPPSSKSAFALQPPGPVRGHAVVLHGYTGTPYEVLPVAMALAERGFVCHGPVVAGHSDDWRALNRLSHDEWLQSVEPTVRALPRGVPRLYVGCSMGALLALRLLARDDDDDVIGAALLAPALCFTPSVDLAVQGLARGLWRAKPVLQKEQAGGDCGDPDGRAHNPTYPVMPTRGLVELQALQGVVRRELPRVRVPLCVLHGEQDHTIPPVASEQVVALAGSALVEHHRLEQSCHLLAIDVERDLVCDLVVAFAERALRARSDV